MMSSIVRDGFGFVPPLLRFVRMDGFTGQKFISGIDNRRLAAGSETGIDSKNGFSLERRHLKWTFSGDP